MGKDRAAKIKQVPRVSKNTGHKPSSIGSAAKGGAKATGSHFNPTAPKHSTKGGHGSHSNVNPNPVIEYPGEGKNKTPFGAHIKHVG